MMEGVVEVSDEIVDRLYELPPEKFIAARDEAADAARRAGDRATATAIGKLRRPTVAAWLVNLLARRAPPPGREAPPPRAAPPPAQHRPPGGEPRGLGLPRRAA